MLAARRAPLPEGPVTAPADRGWQGLAAGLVSGGTGALTAAVLGTGTTALMLKSAWLRGWLYHGQHLTASALYGRELYASMDQAFYGAIGIAFPLVAAVTGLLGALLCVLAAPRASGGPAGPLEPDYPAGAGGR